MLTLHSVTRQYHEQPVFKPLSGTLQSGQAWWLQGPNGSGKTTMLRILSGLLSHEGSVLWQDKPIEVQRSEYARITAYLGHRHGLYEPLSAKANLVEARLWREKPLQSDDLSPHAAALGLAPMMDKPIWQLSEGQKRKVAWLRLLQSNAALWLLDEPFNALDHASTVYLKQVCQKHLADGGMIVLSSHQSHIELPFERIVALESGVV